MDNLLFECLTLGVDVILFGFCYRHYRKKSHSAKAVKDAPSLNIDSDLYKKIQKNGNCIPYAVICGVAKAASNYLPSQYVPHVRGVIREKITKERKVKWSPMLRMWSTLDQDIQRSNNVVPFAIVGSGHWFKSRVEVIDPLSAEELTLTTIYDHFISHDDTFGEIVAGWFRGERITGIQEIENMLTENTLLTGVGELIIEDGVVKLRPPTISHSSFFLTSLSVESLIKKLKEEATYFKILSIILGCLGIFILSSILSKFYKNHKRKLELAKQRERHREASRMRRMADPSRNANIGESSAVPSCVICLSHPVEVIILECGHACLCLDCSESIQDTCPVCRAPIDRVAPAYLP